MASAVVDGAVGVALVDVDARLLHITQVKLAVPRVASALKGPVRVGAGAVDHVAAARKHGALVDVDLAEEVICALHAPRLGEEAVEAPALEAARRVDAEADGDSLGKGDDGLGGEGKVVAEGPGRIIVVYALVDVLANRTVPPDLGVPGALRELRRGGVPLVAGAGEGADVVVAPRVDVAVVWCLLLKWVALVNVHAGPKGLPVEPLETRGARSRGRGPGLGLQQEVPVGRVRGAGVVAPLEENVVSD
mmetsp:Transcript_32649/g.83519  ORF Transcript_32649/g.83519 Transcript_32649/m.83519 type:complete len:248 (-) Transcript_32649:1698-2441(-)